MYCNIPAEESGHVTPQGRKTNSVERKLNFVVHQVVLLQIEGLTCDWYTTESGHFFDLLYLTNGGSRR